MKKPLIAALAALMTLTAVPVSVHAQPLHRRHHRVRICRVRHRHRVCRWVWIRR